jgi:hypothetical protein
MLFMNRFEVQEMLQRLEPDETPNLYAAAAVLARLIAWTDANSDGWAYYPKPARSAKNLIELLYARNAAAWDPRDPRDITEAELNAACRPIKAMLTRTGISGANETVFPKSESESESESEPEPQPTVTVDQLSGIRAWASVLEASLRDDTRTDRIRDDAHDLVMAVSGLLQEFGTDVIWDDPTAADKALGEVLMGGVSA